VGVSWPSSADADAGQLSVVTLGGGFDAPRVFALRFVLVGRSLIGHNDAGKGRPLWQPLIPELSP
jgi:hypothetical protein